MDKKIIIVIVVIVILCLATLAVGLYFAFRSKEEEPPILGATGPTTGTSGATGSTTGTSGATGSTTGTSGATGPDTGTSGATGPTTGNPLVNKLSGICINTDGNTDAYANTWSYDGVGGCNVLTTCLAPYNVGPRNTCISDTQLITNLSDVNRQFSTQSPQIQKYIIMKNVPAIEDVANQKITGIYSSGALLYLASMHFTSDGTPLENTEMINYFKNLTPDERITELQGTGKYLKAEVVAANTAAATALAASRAQQSSATAKSLTSLTTLPTTKATNLNPVDNKPYKPGESFYPAEDSYIALGIKFPIIGTNMSWAGIYSDWSKPPSYGYTMQVNNGSIFTGTVEVQNNLAYGLRSGTTRLISPKVAPTSRQAEVAAAANGPYSLWFKMDGSIQQTDAKGNTTNPTTNVAYFSTKSPEVVSGAIITNRPYVLTVDGTTGKLMISPKNPSISVVGLKTPVEVKLIKCYIINEKVSRVYFY